MSLRTTLLSFVLVLLPTSLFAQSQVIFEQLPNQANFTFSDAHCNSCGPGLDQSLAENFIVTSASNITLTEIVIWGVHDNGMANDPNFFNVNIYEDQGGAVGTLLFQESGMTWAAVPTGITFGFGSEAEVEVTLTPAAPPQLPTGVYWIEIYNDTVGVPSSWGWESAVLDPGAGIDGHSFSTTTPASTWFPDNATVGNPNRNLAMRLMATGATGLGTTYCTSLPNSSGNTAQILAQGSNSIADQALALTASGLPSGVNGLFYYGTNQLGLPFGNGIRCVGGVTQRLSFVQADASGVLQVPSVYAIPTPNLPIAPGTRNFQAWFRDPTVGAGFNLSDGVSITFVP